MLLQAARWVLKQLAAGAASPAKAAPPRPGLPRSAALADPGAYLREAGRNPSATSPPLAASAAELAGSPALLLSVLREAARVLAVRAAAELRAHVAASGSGGARGSPAEGEWSAAERYERAWSERASAPLLEAARAHARYTLAACFDAAVADAQRAQAASRPTLGALGALRDLHLLSACDEGASRVLLESGHLTASHTLGVRARALELLPAIRRDAVALVNAFGLTDLELNSVLGRADGDVYTHLLAWARRSPLNESQVLDGFEEHVRPIMGRCSL